MAISLNPDTTPLQSLSLVFLQGLLNAVAQPLFIKDAQHRWLAVNQAFCDLVGKSKAEIVGYSEADFLEDQNAQEIRKTSEQILVGKLSGKSKIHLRNQREKSQEVVFRQSIFEDELGQLWIVGQASDRYQEIAEALYETEATTRALIKAIPHLLIRCKTDGTCLNFVNDGDFKPQAIASVKPGDNIYEKLPDYIAQERKGYIQKAVQERQLQTYEQTLKINGKNFYEEVRIVPSLEDEVLMIIHDITDRKQAELALKKLNEELENKVEERTVQLQEVIRRLQQEICDRQQAETEIIQTRRFLETILENLPVAVITKEAQQLRFVLWNAYASKLLGFQASEVIGKNDFDFFPPEQADFFAAKDKEVLTSRKTLEIPEEVVQNRQGETRILRTKKTPIFDTNGNPQYLLIIFEDITEYKRAETALIESEKRFRDVSEAAGEYIWELDTQGAYTFVTGRVEDAKGYSPSALIGRSLFEFVIPEDLERVQTALWQSAIDHKPFTLEFQSITSSGETVWEKITGLPLVNCQEEMIGFRGAGLNITERKKAEETLARQAQLTVFRAEVDYAITRSDRLENILEVCTNAVVTHLNAAFARIWTLNAAENVLELQASSGLYTHINGDHARVPVGQFKIGLIAEERLPHLTNDVLSDPRVGNKEWAQREGMIAFAGYPLIVDNELLGVVAMFAREAIPFSTLEALEFAAGEIALAIKKKHAEDALQKSEAQLRQKAQELEAALQELQRTQLQMIQTEKMSSLGQLVAGVAHEINNPVNFIYGNLNYARDYIQELLNLISLYQEYYPDPVLQIQEEIENIDLEFIMVDLPKLLSSMKIGAERIREIVLSLRTFSRLDEAECKEINIHEGIDSTLIILENRLKSKLSYPGIQIIKNYGNLPLVECYGGQLNQVFMNVLTNAIDALDEKDNARSLAEIQAEPSWIKISTETCDKSVIIRIVDNANGIPEAIKQRIFDPFFTTKPVGKGTGMGMSISYQIITENHQGTLECISQAGQGTEFIIQIPIRQR